MAPAKVKVMEMDKSCSYELPPEAQNIDKESIEHPNKLVGHLPLPFPGSPHQNLLFDVVYHDNCFCNLELGLRNRVIASCPQPTTEAIVKLKKLAKRLASTFPDLAKQGHTDFYQNYPRSKFQRYDRGYWDFINEGVSIRGGSITAFVKPDKINPSAKHNAIPRLIQFRGAPFAVAVAAFLKPIEEHLYRMKFKHPLCPTGSKLIAKGMNSIERARSLRKKMEAFDNPCVISFDMSRFDMHVSASLLRVEHYFYNLIYGFDPELVELLKRQLNNKGSANVKGSDGKMKYNSYGRRMSGDMNTALGNCVLMILMTILFCLENKLKFEILDDGDDCLLITEEVNEKLVRERSSQFFLQFGMEVKVENVANCLEKVAFCQSHPIHTSAGWKFVRDPIKVLSTSLSGQRWSITSATMLRKMIGGVGIQEGVLNAGVPVLAAYARALRRIANKSELEVVFDIHSGSYMQYLRDRKLFRSNSKHDLDMPISIQARETFETAFDISIETQKEMEELLDKWTIDLSDPIIELNRFDVQNWRHHDGTLHERFLCGSIG